ncbi:MAG: hypothetical protein AAF399_14170 [Bacteroidota bacterium]
MPSLQVRNVPEHIYQALKAAASEERRSMSQQAIIALERGLALTPDFQERRKAFLAEMAARQKSLSKFSDVDVVGWVQADRDR